MCGLSRLPRHSQRNTQWATTAKPRSLRHVYCNSESSTTLEKRGARTSCNPSRCLESADSSEKARQNAIQVRITRLGDRADYARNARIQPELCPIFLMLCRSSLSMSSRRDRTGSAIGLTGIAMISRAGPFRRDHRCSQWRYWQTGRAEVTALRGLDAAGEYIGCSAVIGETRQRLKNTEALSRVEAFQFRTQPQDSANNVAEPAPRTVGNAISPLD